MKILLDIPLTLKQIANFCKGILLSDSIPTVNYITTNSKLAEKGDLFIALNGKNTSGALYIDEAKEKGALILSEVHEKADIYVKNSEEALLHISSEYKKLFNSLLFTVAITGSVGKTTTKEILAILLSQKYKIHSTFENQNNRIGTAYTLLSLKKDTEILIAELGMNNAGEISELSKSVKPNIGIITNIGNAHLGNFGSRENICRAKLEIRDGIYEEKLILPAEEPLLSNLKSAIYVSSDNRNALYYAKISENGILTIKTPVRRINTINLSISVPGLENAISLILPLLDILNLSDSEILSGFSQLNYAMFRQKEYKLGDLYIYDDTYSSSPEAVTENFKYFIKRHRDGQCVLGDMLELGEKSHYFHRYIGEKAAEYGFKKIYLFGKMAEIIKNGAVEKGFLPNNIFVNIDINAPEITAKQIVENSEKNSAILFKGSHDIKLNRIIKILEKFTEI